MNEITKNVDLIASCGLYCCACKSYLKGKCPGCHENEKASWCQLRKCNIEHAYSSCADCKEFADIMECPRFNNFISKLFGLIFRSDRKACVMKIRESGYEGFASFMAENKLHTIRR